MLFFCDKRRPCLLGTVKGNMMKNHSVAGLLGAVLVTSALLLGCSSGITGKSDIGQGMDAMEQQDYATAVAFFNDALSKGEDERQAYRGLGIAHMGLGEYEEARKDFKKALAGSNGLVKKIDYDINYYLAMAQYKTGDFEGALETLDAILALNKKSADAHYLRGRLYLLKNDREGAIADFDKAVELNGGDYDLYIKIYEGLTASGFNDEAAGYLRQAVDRKGKMTKYQSGIFAYYLGNYDEARSSLESAREAGENDNVILYLGRAYEALGDVNYASTLYSEYIDKGSAGASIYNELGLIRIRKGEYEDALEALQAGKELNDPSYMQSIMFNEAVAYEYLLDFKKAAVLMKEYLDRYPNDEEAQREYVFLSTR